MSSREQIFEKALAVANSQRDSAIRWAKQYPDLLIVDEDAPVVEGSEGYVLVAAWIKVEDSVTIRQEILNAF